MTAGLNGWNLLKKKAFRYPCPTRVKKMFYARVRRMFCTISEEGNLIYSKNADYLMDALNQHDTNELHLFIDSTKVSLRTASHNANRYPSIPMNMTFTWKNFMKICTFLRNISSMINILGVSVEAELATLLFGIQLGCMIFSCFLCEWDARAR
jgi:hypothetical protein